MPSRRRLWFDRPDDIVADVEHLLAGGYEPTGNWTLSQVCDHLSIFFRGSLDGFEGRLPWVVRFFLGKPILWIIYARRGMPAGVKAPRVFLPGEPAEDAAAAETLIELARRFRDHDGPLQPSPLFGRLSKKQWDRLHRIHAAHHLSFLVAKEAAAV